MTDIDDATNRFLTTLRAVAASEAHTGVERIEAAYLAHRVEEAGEVLPSIVAPVLARLRARDGTAGDGAPGGNRGGETRGHTQ